MKKYLSIGEVSKIKGVSVKSLRYYGKLGILPPVYINEKTGYRYYSIYQLVIVDLIVVCLDLGIPLKNFREYQSEDGCVDIGKFLSDGENIVKEKIEKLKHSIAFLDTMSKHIERTNKVKNKAGKFTQHIGTRYFLTADWSGDIHNYKEISSKYSQIFKQCTELFIPDTFNQGVVYIKEEEKTVTKVFVEIPYKIENIENLIVIIESDFICEVIHDTKLTSVLEKEKPNVLIIKELFDLKLEPQSTLLEVQKISKWG